MGLRIGVLRCVACCTLAGCGAILGVDGSDPPPPAPPAPGPIDGSTPEPPPPPPAADASGDASGDAADAGNDAPPACVPSSCASHHCTDGKCDPLVFVTSGSWTGTLGYFTAGDPVGIAAGDARCAEAATGHFTGTFKAWLSDQMTNAKDRFSNPTRPYWRPDGVKVADNQPGLLVGSVMNAISVDETGTVVPFGAMVTAVWTGTTASGVYAGKGCTDWASVDPPNDSGEAGNATQSTVTWTDQGIDNCALRGRLYCFEIVP